MAKNSGWRKGQIDRFRPVVVIRYYGSFTKDLHLTTLTDRP